MQKMAKISFNFSLFFCTFNLHFNQMCCKMKLLVTGIKTRGD